MALQLASAIGTILGLVCMVELRYQQQLPTSVYNTLNILSLKTFSVTFERYLYIPSLLSSIAKNNPHKP